MKKNMKWYEVTITESYTATYKILAEDERDAYDIGNELVNNGVIDPTEDGGDSYDREVDVCETDTPDDDDIILSRKDIDE